jgi:hypothetical protein
MNAIRSLRAFKLTATLVAALATGSGALAQSAGGVYGGISIGNATDFGTAVKLYVGAPLGPRFGWEAQYTNFGSVTEATPFGPQDASAFALGGSLVGYLPLQNTLSGFGKIGLHYVDAKASLPGTSSSDTSIELGIGVGMLWQVAPKWGLRAELENIGGSGGSLFTVGAQIKF